MALKYTVDTLEGLDESIAALYVEKDGKFVLAVEGVPQPKPDHSLAERLQKLEENNRALLDEKRKAKEEAERIKMEAAKESGTKDDIDKSWSEKYNRDVSALKQEWGSEKEKLMKTISDLTVGSTATAIAAEVFGEHADLMMPHVNKRLMYELDDDGNAKVRVLSPEGKLSASSLDDLKAEFKTAEKFSPFVVGTRANGSGAGNSGSGRPPSTKKFSEHSAAELKDIRARDPQEYDRLKAADSSLDEGLDM